tara:strand:- start:3496 stop:3933 length:438 start_codon:yes stop_codon:yes gene_type:complete
MFGIPLEIITLLVSTLMGAYLKSKAQDQQDRHDQMMGQIQMNKAQESNIQNARQFNTEHASKTRKFIVTFVLMLAAYIVIVPSIFDVPTVVPVEVTTGFKFLFLNTMKTVTHWVPLNGVVTPIWLPATMTSIIGFYFGQAMAQRK